MAFNFGAFAAGFSESVAEGIKDNEKRVNLLVDKAWDTHTQRYWKKRDKEENKAELVEGAIKKLAQLTDGNIDHAAALYNKIGNVDDADMFATNGMELKGSGVDLTNYIGSMPDDFKSSNYTVEDYSKSFMKPITFETDLGMGTQDGVAEGLEIRREQMEGLGIPSSLEPTKVTFADLSNSNITALTMPQNSKQTKEILKNAALKAKNSGDEKGFANIMESIIAVQDIEDAAKGSEGDIKQIEGYKTAFFKHIKNSVNINKALIQKELEGEFVSDGQGGITFIAADPDKYQDFLQRYYDSFSDAYKNLKGKDLRNFETAYKAVTGAEFVKNTMLSGKNKDKNKVDIPEKTNVELIEEYKKGNPIIVTESLAKEFPSLADKVGKQVTIPPKTNVPTDKDFKYEGAI